MDNRIVPLLADDAELIVAADSEQKDVGDVLDSRLKNINRERKAKETDDLRYGIRDRLKKTTELLDLVYVSEPEPHAQFIYHGHMFTLCLDHFNRVEIRDEQSRSLGDIHDEVGFLTRLDTYEQQKTVDTMNHNHDAGAVQPSIWRRVFNRLSQIMTGFMPVE